MYAQATNATTTEYRVLIDQADIGAETGRTTVYSPPRWQRRWAGEATIGGAKSLQQLAGWQQDAIRKIAALGNLPNGWDGYGGMPPLEPVRMWAIDLIADVQLGNLGMPEFGPIARGGLQIDWWSGYGRELELHIAPDLSISYLRIEHGNPLDEGPVLETGISSIQQLLTWLKRG